jgi:hypothetical protein
LQQRSLPQVCAAYLQRRVPGEHAPGHWMLCFYPEILLAQALTLLHALFGLWSVARGSRKLPRDGGKISPY